MLAEYVNGVARGAAHFLFCIALRLIAPQAGIITYVPQLFQVRRHVGADT